MRKFIYKNTSFCAFFLVLAACSSPRPAQVEAPAPPAPAVQAAAPAAVFDRYLQARAAGQQVLRIDPAQTLITITVRRSGPLARMGHDHVVSSRAVEGFAAPGLGHGALRFRLDQLVVDDPALRRAAGLETQPSVDAIDGTRRNMLNKVLEAEHYPWLVVEASQVTGHPDMLDTAITLHGVTRHFIVPATVQRDAGQWQASGSLTVKQTDFGLVPFAVFGGALAVKDELELRFTISARL